MTVFITFKQFYFTDNSFIAWKICNIMSNDATAVLTLASGHSKLYTQN